MVVEDPGTREQSVGFPVVSRQVKSRDFGNAIGGPWMKGRALRLRDFLYLAKHLARSRKIKAAARSDFANGGQHVMRAVDIGIQS